MKAKCVDTSFLTRDALYHVQRMGLDYPICVTCMVEGKPGPDGFCSSCDKPGNWTRCVQMDAHPQNGGVVIYRAGVFPAVVYADKMWYAVDGANTDKLDYAALGDYDEAAEWSKAPLILRGADQERRAAIGVIIDHLITPLSESLMGKNPEKDNVTQREDRGRIIQAKFLVVYLYYRWLYQVSKEGEK